MEDLYQEHSYFQLGLFTCDTYHFKMELPSLWLYVLHLNLFYVAWVFFPQSCFPFLLNEVGLLVLAVLRISERLYLKGLSMHSAVSCSLVSTFVPMI